MSLSRADFEALDAKDSLSHCRDRFSIPDGLIYLDGNSLGVLPASTPERMQEVVKREWGESLIRAWNAHDWISRPETVAARVAPLIGARPEETLIADTVSVNLFKLAAGAMRLRGDRSVILTEAGNFPTDLYMLHGLAEFMGRDIEVRALPREDIEAAIDQDVALLALTHVHYKTGAMFDLAALTAKAQEAGALTLWDLSHSTGAVEVDLNGAGADFAVGCGYKYLNGGPGAPGFLFIAERHQDAWRSPLPGWLGHSRPFDFVDDYEPASGVKRALCSSPSILGIAALEEGLKTFDDVAMRDIRAKSRAMGELFLELVQLRCPGEFSAGCPRDPARRGSQASLRHPDGYAIMQALIARGVIGDFRDPDTLRFGFTPLYLRYVNIYDAVEILADIMETGLWRDPKYAERAAVT